MAKVYRVYPGEKKVSSGLSLTTKLIAVNLFAYFIGIVLLGVYGEEFLLNNVALTPALILSGASLWTFLTSMFMHGSFFHIFANMFSLFFIGNFVEKIIGRKRYFWLYIISGLVGGLFFVVSAMIFGNIDAAAVGASGAVFGLLGILAVLVPHSKVYLIAGPLVLIVADVLLSNILPTSAFVTVEFLINILIFVMIFAMFSFNPRIRKLAIPIELPMWLLPIIAIVPLVIIGFFVDLPIGNSAHLGGLIVGLIYGFYLRKKFPNKTKNLGKLFR